MGSGAWPAADYIGPHIQSGHGQREAKAFMRASRGTEARRGAGLPCTARLWLSASEGGCSQVSDGKCGDFWGRPGTA